MTQLSGPQKKALKELNKFKIDKEEKKELNYLRNQKKLINPYKLIIIYFLITVSLGGGIYWYYQLGNNDFKQPRQTITTSKSTEYIVTPKNNSPKSYTKKVYSKKSYPETNQRKPASTKNDNDKIYYWTDKNGIVHMSNVGIPENVKSSNFINKTKQFNDRITIEIKGNSIYIPVTLTNNGISITTDMLLDTGCSRTLINTNLAQKLKLKSIRTAQSIVADGRNVYGKIAKIESIIIGSYTENNMEISYRKHAGPDNKGLLGMDFLKKHPFKIDMKNKLLIWQ